MFYVAATIARAEDEGIEMHMQSERYFKHRSSTIRWWFGMDIPPMKAKTVSIHVRRGDYLNPVQKAFHGALGIEYYREAMKLFPGCRFIVFSDDIPWCRENFTGDEFSFSEGKDEISDMNEMASCEHHIIANSSYSWWAAWIPDNEGKKVVCPECWYNGGEAENRAKRITECPPEWIRMPSHFQS